MNRSAGLPRQFALDLTQAPKPSLHNFLPSGNEELLHAIKDSINLWSLPSQSNGQSLNQRWFYWWGKSGSGRTHLLQAIIHQAKQSGILSIGLQPDQPNHWIDVENKLDKENREAAIAIAVDDVDQLDSSLQASLFRILNKVHAAPHLFVYLSGNNPPAHLQLREDLRTRLGWGLIFELHPLTDSEKIEALSRAAKDRGLTLSTEVLPWLTHHFYRDMPSLMALLDALDAYSLETKRSITLPLVRELLGISGTKQ